MFNPGWVDLQVNGHIGVDYSDPDLTADDFMRSAEALFAVTGVLSSSITAFTMLGCICFKIPRLIILKIINFLSCLRK